MTYGTTTKTVPTYFVYFGRHWCDYIFESIMIDQIVASFQNFGSNLKLYAMVVFKPKTNQHSY